MPFPSLSFPKVSLSLTFSSTRSLTILVSVPLSGMYLGVFHPIGPSQAGRRCRHHSGRPPGSVVQPVRGRRTTASPSVPRVCASTVYGETLQFPESRGLLAGLVFLSVRSPARGGPSLVRAPLSFAPCMVLSAPPRLGPIPSKVRPSSSQKAGACQRDLCL